MYIASSFGPLRAEGEPHCPVQLHSSYTTLLLMLTYLFSPTLPLSNFKLRSSLGFSFSGSGSPCLTCRLSSSLLPDMSVSDAGQTRSLTKTWMTLLESFPTGEQKLILFWIFVLGLLAFKPLLVLGICLELRFGSLLGCHLSWDFGSKSLFSGLLACKQYACSHHRRLNHLPSLSPRGLRRMRNGECSNELQYHE